MDLALIRNQFLLFYFQGEKIETPMNILLKRLTFFRPLTMEISGDEFVFLSIKQQSETRKVREVYIKLQKNQ